MEPIEKVDVYCTDKDKTVSCDVLRKTDKHMRVVLPGDLPYIQRCIVRLCLLPYRYYTVFDFVFLPLFLDFLFPVNP